MENDEFALIEDASGNNPVEASPDDGVQDGQLSDEDMEKLFDEVEQEEKGNRSDKKGKKGSSDEADKKP